MLEDYHIVFVNVIENGRRKWIQKLFTANKTLLHIIRRHASKNKYNLIKSHFRNVSPKESRKTSISRIDRFVKFSDTEKFSQFSYKIYGIRPKILTVDLRIFSVIAPDCVFLYDSQRWKLMHYANPLASAEEDTA